MPDLQGQYLPGELEALLALGEGPDLPPEVIEQMLVERGVRSPRRAPRDPGPLIPLDAPLSALVAGLYEDATSPGVPPAPGAPPAPPSGPMRPEGLRGGAAPPAPSAMVEPPAGEPWLRMLPSEQILAGANRMMIQGTPGSAAPGDLAQVGGFTMPPGPVPPPEKPPGSVYTGPPAPPGKPSMLSIPAIRQRMLMEAAGGPQTPLGAVAAPLPAAAPGSAAAAAAAAQGVPVPPPDPIAKGAQAAQQAAATGAAQQAQTDPFAGLPPALAAALREYTAIAADLKKQDDAARWMALAKAGFAMAGSNKGFLGALGEGGMAGLEAFQAAQQDEAQRRMQAAGMDLDVAKLTNQWQVDQAAAEREAAKEELNARLIEARIGSLNRGNRGGSGTPAQQGITPGQYLTMVQREADNLRNNPAWSRGKTDAEIEAAAESAVQGRLQRLGVEVRGAAGGGGGAPAATGSTPLQSAAQVPEDVMAIAAQDGDVIQSDDGSVWIYEDGEYAPYSEAQ